MVGNAVQAAFTGCTIALRCASIAASFLLWSLRAFPVLATASLGNGPRFGGAE
jgi:hypothetical protein